MVRNWAIAIGINHYENFRSLNFAKLDASVMATWFQEEARFEQVFLFTDDSPPIAANPPIPTQPTFGHLRRFLRAQFENIQFPLLKPEDNLWFFFAGHGNRYKDKDYLMFSDSDPGDVENTAISVDYVTQRLRRSGADNVVLFLDACRDESSRSGLGIGEQSYQGVITFYSCTANHKSWEIDELQHGSFTHSLLEGLRLQGEANCATVERLAQYFRYQVPDLNTRYGKPAQNPYLQAEPPYKMYFILLEQTATLRDVEPLKYQASQAENRGNLSLAKQLWVRVLAVSRGDLDAIDAIGRIALHQQRNFEPILSKVEIIGSSSGGKSASDEREQAENRKRQQEEAERLRRQQNSTTPAVISRQKFLKWAGLGGAGLVTAVVGREIFISISPKLISLQSFNFQVVTVNSQGEITRERPSQAKFFTEDLGNGITLDMVEIPAGSFKMGTENEEIERLVQKFKNDGFRKEKPQREVTVQSFLMGKYPVTQAQWRRVAALPKVKVDLKADPSNFEGDNRPVEQVSWYDAVEFCDRLSKHTNKQYRLPSEAEWEYACRAGTTTPFHFGETITTDLANYNGSGTYAYEPQGKDRRETTKVGSFP
ncbi:MAG: SUMF1/EgtB/PvdO family nonheme iron enzyme, partial [Hassallia sp.]